MQKSAGKGGGEIAARGEKKLLVRIRTLVKGLSIKTPKSGGIKGLSCADNLRTRVESLVLQMRTSALFSAKT